MDGDTAGMNAMNKVISVVLPLLKPGYSLKFIKLPAGYDPDNAIKTYGSIYFKNLTKKTVNLSEMIWNIYSHKINFETPENKALLKKTLMQITHTIQNTEVKEFYKQFFTAKLSPLFTPYLSKQYKHKKPLKTTILCNEKVIENLPTLQRYELALIAMIIKHPELLKNQQIFEQLSAIHPRIKSLDNIYSIVVTSFSEISSDTKENLLLEILKTKIKNNFTEKFFNYLCGTSSYFVDTISTKNIEETIILWFDTFERYSLELIKEEYKTFLQNIDDEQTIEKASKLKKEIENKEKNLKTLYNNE